jgi:L-iditol 2-dehydrogenase
VATDIAPPNLAAATRLGADLAIDGGADPIHAVLAATGGADLVVETTGVPKVLEQAVQMIRPHGVVVCLGNLPRQSILSSAFIEEMMKREGELRGNWMSYSSPFPGREWQATLDAMRSGALDAEAMISDRLPLAAAPEVFHQIHSGQFHRLKIILYPPDGTHDA